MKKRILSLLLTLLMALSVFPLSLLSTFATKYTANSEVITETVVNYSTLAGASGSEGMIKDIYRDGACTKTYEGGVYTYGRPNVYSLSAESGVTAEGKSNLVKIKSLIQGNAWNGPAFHFAYDTGVQLQNTKYLTMSYFYKRNSGQSTGGSIGKCAWLQIKIGGKNFFVKSENAIKAGEWDNLRFNLSGLSSDANYDSVKSQNISEIFIYYYDNDIDSSQSDKLFSKNYALPANDIFYISDFDYMDGVPAITYTATFMANSAIFKQEETTSSVTMPDYTNVEVDYYLQGWSDGTNLYAVGDVVNITDNTTFTAVIKHVNTEENFETSAGEAITRTINTASLDANVVRVTFNFAQNGTSSGSASDGALLSINGQKTIRITGGSGLHVFQVDDPWYVSGTQTWDYVGANYPSNPVSATLVFLLDSGKVNISYKGKSCTLEGFDFSEAINLKFGGADAPKIQISNYAHEELTAQVVTLVSDGNAISETPVVYGDTFTLPYDTQKSGYHLVGWTDGTNTYSRKEVVTIYKDKTFTAIWGEGQGYKVTFKCGSNYTAVDYLPSPVVMPNPSSFNGSVMSGWNDGTNSRYQVGEEVEISKDTTFTAVYTKTIFDVPFLNFNGTDFTTVATKSTTSSSSKVTTPAAPEKSGYTFKGWTKDFLSFVDAETEIDVNTDNRPYYAVYEAAGHTSHSYTNYAIPASCYDAEITYRICECGKINTYTAADNVTINIGSITGPVAGHTYGAYVVDGDYQTRTCSVCSHSETKKVAEIANTTILYAIGDSITFGQKVSGYRDNSYAKYLADELGLTYVNQAASGSRLSAWRSVLTQSNNHNQWMDNHAGGVTRESMVTNIQKAGVVVFTLSANDLFATNTAANIETRMYEFVDEIHRINPDAIVIIVNGAYMVSFWDSATTRLGVANCYSQYQWPMAELNKRYTEGFATAKYDYAYYVDVSKEYSTLASFTEGITGNPDGVHPGQVAYQSFKTDIVAALGNVSVVTPSITYTVTFKNTDNTTVSSTDAYGLLTMPEAPTPLNAGDIFKGWTNDGGATLYKAGAQVNIKSETTFTAVFRTPKAAKSYVYNFSDLTQLETAIIGFSDGGAIENGLYTYTNSDRYKYTVEKDVIFNGTKTFKMTSLINTNTAGQASNQGLNIPVPQTLDIEDVQYLTLTYYYNGIDNTNNAGVKWVLTFTVDGDTYTIESENLVVEDTFATLKFDLSKMSGNFEDYLGKPITSMKLRFYGNVSGQSYGNIKDKAGATYYFATMTLENRASEVSPLTISYVGKDSENLGSDSANYGIITVRQALEAISGYTFKGFKNGETLVNPETTLVIAENTTLDAYYKLIETYNVSFKKDDTTVYSTTTQDTVTAPAAQTKDGYNFTGWSADNGVTVYDAGEEIEITADTVFEAQFVAKTYGTVTIMNGGNQVSATQYEDGTQITLPENALEDENNKFTGWSDGTNVYQAGAQYTVNGNVTFTGQWTAVVWRYITYKDALGNTIKTYKVENGTTFQVKIHSVTKGKSTNSYTDGTSTYTFNKDYTATKDLTLTPNESVALENYVNNSGYTTLANTLYKLNNNQKVTVGIIGDSIGYGQIPGGINAIEGVNYNTKYPTGGKNPMAYPRVFSDWIDYFVESELEIENADIDYYYSVWGGANLYTTTGYISEDILAYNPDLFVIEVWNAITRNGVNVAWLESMIQMIYAKNPYADIILLDVGGEFSLGEHNSIAQKYGIPFIRADKVTKSWFNNANTFGLNYTVNSNTYGPDANGSIQGTRGYYYNNGHPHVNEECYEYWNYLFSESFEALVELAKLGSTYGTYSYAQPATRRVTMDGDTVVYPTDTVSDLSKLIFYSTDITADEMTTSNGTWTLTGSVDRTAPLDSADRASACKLTPSAVGDSVTVTFTGCGFLVRGGGSFTYSIDGGAAQTLSIGSYVEIGTTDAQHTIVFTCTATKDAKLQEVYLYAHAYQAVANHENVKDRNVVAYYAKLNDEYIHNGTRNGNAILPVYLTYYNLKRVDTWGDETHTILGSSILFTTCETKGEFVGWMEADTVTFVDGEKIPSVAPFYYTKDGSGNITGATYVDGGANKRIYFAGDEIDPEGNTLNLVAVFKNSAADAVALNVTFKDGDTTISNVSTYGQLTVADALSKDGYTFIGWSNGTATYRAGVILDISESTSANITFTAVWRDNSAEVAKTYNVSDMLLSTFESLVSYSKYSYNYALEQYTASVTDQNGIRYQHRLSRNVTFDNKNVVEIYGLSMPGAGSSTPAIKFADTGIKVKDAGYVLIEYYLSSPTNNTCAGQTMKLNFYVNGVKYTVSATEAIVKGEWKTAQFNILDSLDVATLGEYEITDMTLEFTGNISGNFNAKIPQGASMNLSTLEFTNGHTAKFKDGNGTVIAGEDISAIDGVITLPNIASLTDATNKLVGWSDGVNEYEVGEQVTITADTQVFTPLFETIIYYNVTFKSFEETLAISGSYPEVFNLPAALTEDGYRFDGWQVGDETVAAGTSVTITGDTTITAVWTKIYHVTVNDGSTVLLDGDYAGEVTLPTYQRQDGYVFLGYSDGTTTYKAGETLILSGNTTLNAVRQSTTPGATLNLADDICVGDAFLRISGSVLVNGNGYRIEKGTYENQSVMTISSYMDHTGNQYNMSFKFTALDLKVTDSPYIVLTYKLERANANQASSSEGKQMMLQFKVKKNASNDAFADRNTFYVYGDVTISADGWQTVVFDLNNLHAAYLAIRGDAYDYTQLSDRYFDYFELQWCSTLDRVDYSTFFAKNGENLHISTMTFTTVNPNYTVSFDENGGDTVSDVTSKGTATLPEITYAGHVFLGWSIDNGTTLLPAGSQVAVSGDVTYKAFWREFEVKFYDYETLFTTLNGTTSVTAPECTIVKDGETFVGWKLGETTYEVGDTIDITGDTTLTAVWKGAYTATFMNGDTQVGVVNDVKTFTIPDYEMVEAGKEFVAWKVGDVSYQAGDVVTLTENTTFTVEWRIETIDAIFKDGDTVIDTVSVDSSEDDINIIKGLTKAGYVFVGWTDGSSIYVEGDTVRLTDDTTFTAVFATYADYDKYHLNISDDMLTTVEGAFSGFGTMTYVSGVTTGNKGTSRYKYLLTKDEAYDGHTTVKLYCDYYSMGYDFAGCYLVIPVANGITLGECSTLKISYYFVTGQNQNDSNSIVGEHAKLNILAGGKTLTVVSTNTFIEGEWDELVFDLSSVTTSGNSANTITSLSFNWANGNLQAKAGDSLYLSDMIFSNYDESFNSYLEYYNSGEKLYAQLVNGKVTLPAAPTKLDATFKGWRIGETLYDAGDEATITANGTVVAEWAGIYSATFKDGDTQYGQYTEINDITVPHFDVPEKAGYAFLGWSNDGGTTLYNEGENILLSDDEIFEAVWVETYYIIVKNGDTTLVQEYVMDSITLPNAPSKTHYTFTGWSDGVTTYDAGATVDVSADTTFNAVWEAVKYTATFKDGETTIETIVDKTIEDMIIVPKALTKDGYTFLGYSSNGTLYVSGESIIITGNTTFDALYVLDNSITTTDLDITDYYDTTALSAFSGFDTKTYDETNQKWTIVRRAATYEVSLTQVDSVDVLKLYTKAINQGYTESYSFEIGSLNIPVADIDRITLRVYFEGANNQDGMNMQLNLTTDNSKTLVILSNEVVKSGQWNTLTFDIANALNKAANISVFDLTKITSNNITGIGLRWYKFSNRTDMGGIALNKNDTFYFAGLQIANYKLADYTATIKNGDTVLSKAKTNDKVQLPSALVVDGYDFGGWSDGTTTYDAGATVTLTSDTTFSAVLTAQHTHTVVVDQGYAATCFASGLTNGSHCSECQEVIVAQEVIPQLTHNYVNDVCEHCGMIKKQNSPDPGNPQEVIDVTVLPVEQEEAVETDKGEFQEAIGDNDVSVKLEGIKDAIIKSFMNDIIDSASALATENNENITVNVKAQSEIVNVVKESETIKKIKYDVHPVAELIKGSHVEETVYIQNDKLDGSLISVTLSTAGIVPVQVIHTKDNGVKEVFYPEGSGKDKTFAYDSTNGTVTIEISSFSEIELLTVAEGVANFAGTSVTLRDAIAVKMYVTLDEYTDEEIANMTMDFVIGFTGSTLNKSGVASIGKTGDYYVFRFDGITPQCLKDRITATLKLNGEVIATYSNYTILSYLETLYQMTNTTEEVKELISALYTYGKAAQAYSGYNYSGEISSTVIPEISLTSNVVESDPLSGATKFGATTNANGIRICAGNVKYGSVTYLMFLLEGTNIEEDKISVQIGGEDQDITISSGVISMPGLYASEITSTLEIKLLYDGVEIQTVNYGVGVYAYAQERKLSDGNLKNLIRAVYVYGEKAVAIP